MTQGEGGNRRPTSTRGIVIVFAITFAVLQYIDRAAISQAAPLVMKDFALTKEQMRWVFSAFTLAYALFEIPGGYLGDWIGPRKAGAACWLFIDPTTPVDSANHHDG